MASSFVLDASALLALLWDEPGAQMVRGYMAREDARFVICAVNLLEAVTSLIKRGAPASASLAQIESLGLIVTPFDEALVRRGAELAHLSWENGLSLGDRACLATGRTQGIPVLTADAKWAQVATGCEIVVIR